MNTSELEARCPIREFLYRYSGLQGAKEAAASLSTLRQRIEALEAVLGPFAELADFYENCEQHPYGCPDTALCGELPDLTVGSFRAARQALGEG